MLRVVNVISDTNIGGAGHVLLTFLRNYDRTRLNMSVILPIGSKLSRDIAELDVPYTELEGLAERSLGIDGIAALYKQFCKEKPSIVHTHASMSARVAAWVIPGIKIVYTRHSVFPNRRLLTTFPGKQVFGAINNLLTDRIIAVSPAAADNIVETGVRAEKITVIYNGVDPVAQLSAEERDSVRDSFGLGREDFICGIFARLTPVKGHEYILDAAKLLKGNWRVKFVIAGTGESEVALKQRASAEGLSNVIFTGFVNEPERLMASMDVQLNASYGTEATSLALLKGMSAGVPTVASSYGGNPYIIKDMENGLIVPERDGQAVAAAVERLYNDKSLRGKLSQGALSAYRERFTAEKMTRNIEDLYYSL